MPETPIVPHSRYFRSTPAAEIGQLPRCSELAKPLAEEVSLDARPEAVRSRFTRSSCSSFFYFKALACCVPGGSLPPWSQRFGSMPPTSRACHARIIPRAACPRLTLPYISSFGRILVICPLATQRVAREVPGGGKKIKMLCVSLYNLVAEPLHVTRHISFRTCHTAWSRVRNILN